MSKKYKVEVEFDGKIYRGERNVTISDGKVYIDGKRHMEYDCLAVDDSCCPPYTPLTADPLPPKAGFWAYLRRWFRDI